MLSQDYQHMVAQAQCHTAEMIRRQSEDYYSELMRPFILYKPRLAQDGDAWIACLGENLQEGVVGIGDSPDKAARAFDAAWFKSPQSVKESTK